MRQEIGMLQTAFDEAAEDAAGGGDEDSYANADGEL